MMMVWMLQSCWVSPDGYSLRFLRRHRYYGVSHAVGARLLKHQQAYSPSIGEIMTSYPPRLLTLITPPTSEPITLAEAKLFLRVDGNTEDALISSLIIAARQKAEAWLRRSLLSQVWKIQQALPDTTKITLPLAPIQEILLVQVTRLGQITTLTTSDYTWIPETREIHIHTNAEVERVIIQYRTGVSDVGLVPSPIKQAILHAVSHYYHHREQAEDLSAEAKRLLADYREVQL
jgi:uncharacterized phiE125 gp8 family phage protein